MKKRYSCVSIQCVDFTKSPALTSGKILNYELLLYKMLYKEKWFSVCAAEAASKGLIEITFRSIMFRMTFCIYEILSLSYKRFVRERHTNGFGVMQITQQFIIQIVRLLIRRVAQKSHLNLPNLIILRVFLVHPSSASSITILSASNWIYDKFF